MKDEETITCDQCTTEKKADGHVGWTTIKAGLPKSFHDKYELGSVNVTMEHENQEIGGCVQQRFDFCNLVCFTLFFEPK